MPALVPAAVPAAVAEPLLEQNNIADVTHATVASWDDVEIPRTVRLAAAWSWRFIVILLFASIVLWSLTRLSEVMVPIAIALLLSALLSPAVQWLRRHGMHRSLSTAVVLIRMSIVRCHSSIGGCSRQMRGVVEDGGWYRAPR